MGRTESIFATVLLAAVIIAVLAVTVRGAQDPISMADPYGDEPEMGTAFVAFSGNATEDLCMCYEQAYAYGSSQRNINSVEYLGGFQSCSSRLGPDGGDAWSWGWMNGSQALGGPRSCRGYFSQMRNNVRRR